MQQAMPSQEAPQNVLKKSLGFVQAMPLQDALHKVKSARSQANPYVDCWKVMIDRPSPHFHDAQSYLTGCIQIRVMSCRMSCIKGCSAHAQIHYSCAYAMTDIDGWLLGPGNSLSSSSLLPTICSFSLRAIG